MSSMKYWLWLSSAGVSARSKGAVLNHYGDAELAFFAPVGDYLSVPGISRKDAEILEKRDLSGIDRIFERCQMKNIDIVSFQDASYPKRLKAIACPPPVLYVRGRLPNVDEEPVIAVVGTRRASYYGVKMANRITGDMVRSGALIASGLTKGIDYAAAEAALLADGRVIGVLGTAHNDDHYPLSPDVAVRGAVISEYAPGTPSQRSFFRERNRITSGLSVGVVAIEAPERSGTRLFVEEAASQGKEVFAVPGNADAPLSAGTISMLKDGAKLVTCGWDVMSEFEYLFPGRIHQPLPCDYDYPEAEKHGTDTVEDRKTAEKPAVSQETSKKVIDNEKPRGYIDLKEQLSSLTEDQLRIVTAIDSTASHIDDIIEATGLSTATVLAQLTILEIKGFVRREAGRRISLNIAKK